MTNAEAVETLRANYPDACFEQLREAVDAAIEALKAPATVDAIEELRRENESLAKSVNEASEILRKRWIPVTERLPENGVEVLAWSSSGFAYVDWWIDGKWKVNSLVDGKYEHVTHWMPLPEPPKGERKDDETPDGRL